MEVRPAAVAGTFYPGSPSALAADVDAMMRVACAARAQAVQPKALVVPHAGYVYSGPIAASAYAAIVQPELVRRVVLLGPAHRAWLDGVAAPSAQRLRTPLGDVEIDEAALRDAGVPRDDAPHAQEHSIEVQLPFLQRVVPHARVCPIVCGRASASEVASLLGRLWGGDETLVVVSSDLSHYLPYADGRSVDEHTAHKILALDPDLSGDEACGYVGLRGLLIVAREKGLVCEQLDLRSSGDTVADASRRRAKGRDEVVGYGAFAFHA